MLKVEGCDWITSALGGEFAFCKIAICSKHFANFSLLNAICIFQIPNCTLLFANCKIVFLIACFFKNLKTQTQQFLNLGKLFQKISI